MFEFLVLLSTFLVFGPLLSPIKRLLGRIANAGMTVVFQRFAKPVPEEYDNPVLPFEQLIHERLAERRARKPENGTSMA
ncbi:hypothetical protein [Aliiruegeria lutimaris]|uniref:Uncharacterized protein n=1 Tax=Aliiruegeria lutimaris TaxID=571298 RepID=A0A1G9JVG9_9RHOB|nr:hypothetical protein [Aliiruegeria lutimaris]SDL41501.1 hypothetical protein SAMN04488026_108411 [Aliiruegeria lutimaris]